MMKHFLILALIGIAQLAMGQKYFSKTGKVSFPRMHRWRK